MAVHGHHQGPEEDPGLSDLTHPSLDGPLLRHDGKVGSRVPKPLGRQERAGQRWEELPGSMDRANPESRIRSLGDSLIGKTPDSDSGDR